MPNDYGVGYKKPPNHTKFQKGQSGNPNGRPKGSRNMSTIMQEVLGRSVIIRQNGRERRVPLREAFVHRLAGKTLEGNTRDMIALMKAIRDYFPEALEPKKLQSKLIVEFVESDGNGGLAKITPLAGERTRSDKKTTTQLRAGGRNADDALEAAWRASGLDDEPDEP